MGLHKQGLAVSSIPCATSTGYSDPCYQGLRVHHSISTRGSRFGAVAKGFPSQPLRLATLSIDHPAIACKRRPRCVGGLSSATHNKSPSVVHCDPTQRSENHASFKRVSVCSSNETHVSICCTGFATNNPLRTPYT
jgi:hypothetical protein